MPYPRSTQPRRAQPRTPRTQPRQRTPAAASPPPPRAAWPAAIRPSLETVQRVGESVVTAVVTSSCLYLVGSV